MEDLKCKRCGASRYVKRGKVRGLQRYLCKECGCNFTDTAQRGKPASMKALAILLYSMGNASFGMIGRLLGVSDVAVLKWVRAEAQSIPEPKVDSDLVVVTLDEMWHYVQKKLTNSGSGEHMILFSGEPWPGLQVVVMMQPASDCLIKSTPRERY